jgi:hypothetical protein
VLPPLSAAYRFIPSLRTSPDTAWPHAWILLAGLAVINAAVIASSRRGRRDDALTG